MRGQVYIIEANPRASRTVPFVAKAIGHPLAAYASLLMSGRTLSDIGFTEEPVLNHVAVKEAVLPFEKFQGAPLAPPYPSCMALCSICQRTKQAQMMLKRKKGRCRREESVPQEISLTFVIDL